MIASIAGVALALQLDYPPPLNESIPLVQEIRYRRHGRSPPCGNGYDLDERDDKCYPNGTVPPRFQSGRYYPLEYGGGRGRSHAVTALTAIFATALLPEWRGTTAVSGRPPAITIDETATSKCDSAAMLNIRSPSR